MAELAVTQARGQSQMHPLPLGKELREARLGRATLGLECAHSVLGILQDLGIVIVEKTSKVIESNHDLSVLIKHGGVGSSCPG